MNKQQYIFSLTRVRGVCIELNKGLRQDGTYYDTYDYNCSEPISLTNTESSVFELSDDFLGRIVTIALYSNNILVSKEDRLINTQNRSFNLNANDYYVFSWPTAVFEPKPTSFLFFETNKVHPVFSNLSLDKSVSGDGFNWSSVLNSNLSFNTGAFDYISSLSNKDNLIFKIQRKDFDTGTYYTIYESLPFSLADCELDYDKRDLRVNFQSLSYDEYLTERAGLSVDLAKEGYKHERLTLTTPSMLQVYIEGSEHITNIVGGSSTEVDVAAPELPEGYDVGTNDTGLKDEPWWPDNLYSLYMYNEYKFNLIGRISEIRIVGGQPGGVADYYFATTSDSQITQNYTPSNDVILYVNSRNEYYIRFDKTSRALYIKRVSDNAIMYQTSQALNATCLLGPYIMTGTMLRNPNDSTDSCAVQLHANYKVYARILTNKENENAYFNYKIKSNDFAYRARHYTYIVAQNYVPAFELFSTKFSGSMTDVHLLRPVQYSKFGVHLCCSTETSKVDKGLGSKDGYNYYTYKSITQNTLRQHLIPIGNYFWSGVSFYACLGESHINIMKPWYLTRELSCFFTIGTALRLMLQKVAPNVRFMENTFCSSFLYPASSLSTVGTDNIREPNILLTHTSNIQAGLFISEAQKVNMTISSLLEMLRNAYQVYHYIDDNGYLHLEHITWFYGMSKVDNVQFSTLLAKDEYTKKLIDYGQGVIKADKKYLYSSIDFTSDSEDAFELFNTMAVKCLEATCLLAEPKQVSLAGFRTDIDYLCASAGVEEDSITMLVASVDRLTNIKYVTYSRVYRADIKGLNEAQYPLWPTNYKASSYALLQYYRWNFSSLLVDHETYVPLERARYRTQEIMIPADFNIDMLKMVKTRFGEGYILYSSLNLDSRYASLTLLHKG